MAKKVKRVQTDSRPIVYRDDEKIVYRASGFGHCDKALTAARMGVEPAPPPDVLRKAFAEGHRAEKMILDRYVEASFHSLSGKQKVVEWNVYGNVVIRGSVDAIAIENDQPVAIVDAKYLGARYFDQLFKGSLPSMGALGYKYALQGWLYLKALDDPKVDTFTIVAVSKEDDSLITDTWRLAGLENEFGFSEEWVLERLQNIERRAMNSDLNDEGCDEAFGCPYYFLHSDNMQGLFIDSDGISDVERAVVRDLAVKYRAAADAEKRAVETKKETLKILKGYLDKMTELPEELNEDTKDAVKAVLVAYDAKVTRYQTSRTVTDFNAMEEDGIDLSKYQERKYSIAHRVALRKEKK